ncbi:hypothetical protein GGR28_002945 [Lewinella aquimaris]|uniref:Uncharacterized protein n=1 Tax=Neolewinella aquimaris TaxID=1835722 RepID=A0A840E560_9BACT|nr:CRISPR-associated endonuclease Cas6 [Neolewinella aquimaris]MBB4080311.1 hypothetical protein [Neolewinella aquimaris]
MQLTTLTFNFPLHPSDIRAFRASIVEVVGLGHHLFHGHDNSEAGVTKYSNTYPMIRFAVRRGRGCIVGMGSGADAVIRHLLPVLPDTLTIAGTPHHTADYRLEMKNWDPEITRTPQPFGLYQWMALNKENYLDWKKQEGNEVARRFVLDRCLTGHLRALAEAAGIATADRMRIVARVLRQDRVKRIQWHNNKFIAFDAVAEANFLPPYGLGLGRCHSFGFGEVCSSFQYKNLQNSLAKVSLSK